MIEVEPKYISDWENAACNLYCDTLKQVKETLSRDAQKGGPRSKHSRSIQTEALQAQRETPCDYTRTSRCALANFFVAKGLEMPELPNNIRQEET